MEIIAVIDMLTLSGLDIWCMIDNFDISISPHRLLFSAVSRAYSTEAGPGCLQNNFIIDFF